MKHHVLLCPCVELPVPFSVVQGWRWSQSHLDSWLGDQPCSGPLARIPGNVPGTVGWGGLQVDSTIQRGAARPAGSWCGLGQDTSLAWFAGTRGRMPELIPDQSRQPRRKASQ